MVNAIIFFRKICFDELINHNYKVIAFGRNENKLKELQKENVDIFVGDFCNKSDALAATKKVDYVIHCGALSTVWGG